MKKIIIPIFTFLLLANFTGFAQTRTLDSLKKINYKLMDSVKVNTLFKEAESSIDKNIDDFDNSKTFYTQMLKPAFITRIVKKSTITYYLSFSTKGSTLNAGEKGVYVIFQDGTKWIRSLEKIDVEYDDGYEYSSFTTITAADLRLFQRKKVKKFKLYIYDYEVSEEDATFFQIQANYIQLAK